MTGIADVRSALEARLNAIALPLDSQWENTNYVPVSGTPYQKIDLLLADPVNPEMGRLYQETGYMQVSLRFAINEGAGAASAKAQSIRDWFYRGLTLAANGLTVTINRTPIIRSAFIDGDRFVVPVKISFLATNVS